MKKNYSLFGLPEKVKFCKKCVVSNQRPSSVIEFENIDNQKVGIELNDDDICSACKYHDLKSKINWDDREKELEKLLSKYRKKDGYDCVVPGSGGKDSGFTAHILKYKYGMNPLTVTWAPHLYTDIGWQNLVSWSHVGGLDNILFTPNGKLHRYLTKIAFKNLLHPFQPFIIGQRIIGPKIAAKFNIPLVIYGENQAEYGNKIDDNYNPLMKDEYFSLRDPHKIYFGGENIKKIIEDTKFTQKDFEPYLPVDKKELIKKEIKVAYLGYYLKWDPQECYYYAVENCGFKANPERREGTYSKYVSIDDKTDDYHYYTTFIKFGIGRATYDASQEVRNEKITRQEGVDLVRQFDNEFPKKYFKEFLEYLDINEEEFHKTIDQFRSPHLWEKINDQWKLKHSVYN